jgi:hypothetical protein
MRVREHCTSYRASRARRWESVITTVALDGHSCFLPWMITTIYCLAWSQLLLHWLITTVCCPGWPKLFTDNFPNLGQSAAPFPHKHCIWTHTHQNLPPGTTWIHIYDRLLTGRLACKHHTWAYQDQSTLTVLVCTDVTWPPGPSANTQNYHTVRGSTLPNTPTLYIRVPNMRPTTSSYAGLSLLFQLQHVAQLSPSILF